MDSYILWDPNDTKGAITREEVEIMQKELEEKYGKTCYLIDIDCYDSFVAEFNDIGSNGKSIDAVVLNFHGNYNRLAFTGSDGKVQSRRFTTNDMGDITNRKAMDALIFVSCKAGDGSQGDTIANAFAKLTDKSGKATINVVIASDGDGRTKATTERYGILWLKKRTYVRVTADANPNGYKVYWKSVGTPANIGTSFNGLGELIDAAKAAKKNKR